VPEPLASTVYAEETELSPEDLEMEAMMQAALQRAEAAFSEDDKRMRSLAKQASSRSLQSLGGSQKYLSEALAAAVAGDDDAENYDDGDNFEEDDEDSSPPSEGDESSPAQASALRVATRAPPDGDSEGENMPGEELRQASAPRFVGPPEAPPPEVTTGSSEGNSTPTHGQRPAAAVDEVSTVSDDNVGSDVDSNGNDVEPAGAPTASDEPMSPKSPKEMDDLWTDALAAFDAVAPGDETTEDAAEHAPPAAHAIDESDEDDEYDHDFEDD